MTCQSLIIIIMIVVIVLLISINLLAILKVNKRVREFVGIETYSARLRSRYKYIFTIDLAAIIVALSLLIPVLRCEKKDNPVVVSPPPGVAQDCEKYKTVIISLINIFKQNITCNNYNIHYTIIPFPGPHSDEVIIGQKGSYYLVELKAKLAEGQILFPPGQYVLSGFDSKFSEAINEFHQNVIKILRETESEYAIYVTGSADQVGTKTLSRNFDAGYEYGKINYHIKIGIDQYLPDLSNKDITNPYGNEDLPFLRAEFMRQTLSKPPYDLNPTILEGRVSNHWVMPTDRNAKFMLYIK